MTPPKPLCSFHVRPDGTVTEAGRNWPSDQEGYRWLHYDLNAEGILGWLEAHLSDAAAAALQQTETRPRCDVEGDGLILNLRAVNQNPGSDPEDMVSLRLWVTSGLVVSTRIRKNSAADAVAASLSSGHGPRTVGGFLALLTGVIAKRIEDETLALEERTDTLEEVILETEGGHGDELTAFRLAAIKLRRFIAPQREALYRLAALDHPVIDRATQTLLRETANQTTRSVEELDSVRDRLAAIQDHLDAEQNKRIARNGYVLSVAAAIFLPLSFLTGLFGVNLAGIPFADHPLAFVGLTLVSVVIGVVLYVLLRRMRFL